MDLGLLNETHANEAGSDALSEIEAGGQLDSLRQSRVAFNKCDDIAIFELMNESHGSHWMSFCIQKILVNTSTQRRPI